MAHHDRLSKLVVFEKTAQSLMRKMKQIPLIQKSAEDKTTISDDYLRRVFFLRLNLRAPDAEQKLMSSEDKESMREAARQEYLAKEAGALAEAERKIAASPALDEPGKKRLREQALANLKKITIDNAELKIERNQGEYNDYLAKKANVKSTKLSAEILGISEAEFAKLLEFTKVIDDIIALRKQLGLALQGKADVDENAIIHFIKYIYRDVELAELEDFINRLEKLNLIVQQVSPTEGQDIASFLKALVQMRDLARVKKELDDAKPADPYIWLNEQVSRVGAEIKAQYPAGKKLNPAEAEARYQLDQKRGIYADFRNQMSIEAEMRRRQPPALKSKEAQAWRIDWLERHKREIQQQYENVKSKPGDAEDVARGHAELRDILQIQLKACRKVLDREEHAAVFKQVARETVAVRYKSRTRYKLPSQQKIKKIDAIVRSKVEEDSYTTELSRDVENYRQRLANIIDYAFTESRLRDEQARFLRKIPANTDKAIRNQFVSARGNAELRKKAKAKAAVALADSIARCMANGDRKTKRALQKLDKATRQAVEKYRVVKELDDKILRNLKVPLFKKKEAVEEFLKKKTNGKTHREILAEDRNKISFGKSHGKKLVVKITEKAEKRRVVLQGRVKELHGANRHTLFGNSARHAKKEAPKHRHALTEVPGSRHKRK